MPFGARQALPPSRPTPTLAYRLAPSPPHPAHDWPVAVLSVVRPGRPARCCHSTATQSIHRAGASGAALLLTPSPRGAQAGRRQAVGAMIDLTRPLAGALGRPSCPGDPPCQESNANKEWGSRGANRLDSKAKRNCPASSRSVRHDGHPVCAGSSHHDAARPKHPDRFCEALSLAPQVDAINMSIWQLVWMEYGVHGRIIGRSAMPSVEGADGNTDRESR